MENREYEDRAVIFTKECIKKTFEEKDLEGYPDRDKQNLADYNISFNFLESFIKRSLFLGMSKKVLKTVLKSAFKISLENLDTEFKGD